MIATLYMMIVALTAICLYKPFMWWLDMQIAQYEHDKRKTAITSNIEVYKGKKRVA